MNWYFEVLKKYAVFRGRARREEYWMFFLVNFIVLFIVGLIEPLVGGLVGIYQLGTLIPSIAVGVRRLHDTDRRGWWLLVPIFNLVFLCKDSQPETNRFGENPKA